jgi:hypothetical protein
MRKIKYSIAISALAAAVSGGFAQVISPPEIADVQMRELQQTYLTDLKAVGAAISAHSFPYRLYFSRTLDLNESQQQRGDQRSIRFDKFRKQTVVEITANYYAAYSAELMQREQRARRTLDDVIVPMLQLAVPRLIKEEKVQGFAIEISHHVRKKVLGVSTENPENVAFILPRAAAQRLIAAASPAEREAALMQGLLFVDRKPVDGWEGRESQFVAETQAAPSPVRAAAKPVSEPAALSAIVIPQPVEREKPATPVLTGVPPVRVAEDPRPEISPDSLSKLQSAHQDVLDRLVRDLDKQAHFVSYAPPSFIPFHKGVYLQLSVTTTLQEKENGSQYRVAALAFDEHIAHLIRPVLASLKSRPDFDGIDFSASVRLAGALASGVAVEFVFPTEALLRYQDYDCTGQQLINLGFILINGERAGLDLQSAEASIVTQR